LLSLTHVFRSDNEAGKKFLIQKLSICKSKDFCMPVRPLEFTSLIKTYTPYTSFKFTSYTF